MRPLLLIVCALLPVAGAHTAASAGEPRARCFNSQEAYRSLVRQCEFGPRVPGKDEHERCAEWLANELKACADEVTVQRFTVAVGGRPVPLTNIVATFSPGGKRHVLLCAHWDTRPTADCDPEPANRQKPIPGANDGASGVAVLLEIARALDADPPSQRVTIVLFDGEDYGQSVADMFLGSRAFAERYTGPPVEWGVLLDMVGDRDLRLPPEQGSLKQAPEVVDRVWRAAAYAGSEAFVREPGPSVAGPRPAIGAGGADLAILDDHVFLLAKGIPCIDVIDFEYPYWHTLADTPDKCSPESLGQVGRALLWAIAEDEGW